jgi:hypothetical protein
VSKTSQLIRDLDSVPAIVGNLGLSIAGAQKAFNLEYLESLERLLPLIKSMLGKKNLNDDDRTFLEALLTRLMPASYQYTETSLVVRLDLARSERKSVAGNLGVGTGAVTISAGMSAAYGLDYRAAAEVRTVIHARNLEDGAMTALLKRAKALADSPLELPEGTPRIDQEIVNSAKSLAEKVGAEETPEEEKPAALGDGAVNDPPAEGAGGPTAEPAADGDEASTGQD